MLTHFEELLRRRSELTAEMIKVVLDGYGVNTLNWGKPPAKSLAELAHLMTHDEVYLMHDMSNLVLLEFVAIVTVRMNTDRGQITLIESRREFPDGTVQVRNFRGSVSEKVARAEHRNDTAIRGLKEELGLAQVDPSRIKFIEYLAEDPSESPSYPGLKVSYNRYYFDYDMPPNQFKEEYTEVSPSGRITYFHWKPV